MKYKVSANSRSVLNSGLTDDYKKAIAEYVWNGFDAGASCVQINYHCNDLGGIDKLWIVDNGSGINYDSLPITFGTFLDSNKKQTYQRSSNIKGKKGKGRFSYNVISDGASWETSYKGKDDKLFKYKIEINSADRSVYDASEPYEVDYTDSQSTGTIVNFLGLRSDLIEDNIIGSSFVNFISCEFAWFLILNESKKYTIKINGENIDYHNLIGYKEEKTIDLGEYTFNCNFIRWTKKIGDKYYYYLLNSNMQEVCKVLTSFNNKSTTFHHSMYIVSSFFNNFIWDERPGARLDGLIDQSNDIYKNLIKKLRSYLSQKEKEYLKEVGAKNLIEQYERTGVLPKFAENRYGKQRKKELIDAIQGIYAVQPKIFLKLSTEQSKAMVGFLSLLLDSDERNNVISIIGEVVMLTSEEREELAKVLQSTSLSRINSAVNLLKNRLLVVEGLKQIVYDLDKFANEREHIQKIVEKCYWLFGEQYSMVTADETFEKSLLEYTYILDGVKQKGNFTVEDARRRPDIFISQCQSLPVGTHTSFLEENIIVELKRPSITIGKEQFRQIEDYRDIILNEPKFNSHRRKWTFIVVGKKVDDFINLQYKSFEDKNRPMLVQYQENFEIYAMTWDDIFLTFTRREDFILDKLKFDKQVLQKEVENYKKSRDGVNNLTKDLLELNTK